MGLVFEIIRSPGLIMTFFERIDLHIKTLVYGNLGHGMIVAIIAAMNTAGLAIRNGHTKN